MTPPDPPEPSQQLPAEVARRRVWRAALLRPMALLVLFIGGVSFTSALSWGISLGAARAWWIPPLTVATYASLVVLAVRDPAFRARVLGIEENKQRRLRAPNPRRPWLSPEQRAARLRLEATREKVEAALAAHGRVLVAAEESDERTRAALEDALAKLRLVPERLLDVAEAREHAAAEEQSLRGRSRAGRRPEGEEHAPGRTSLEEKLDLADAAISGMPDELLALRAKVVRASIEGDEALPARAAEIDDALDALIFRLDAVSSALNSPDGR